MNRLGKALALGLASSGLLLGSGLPAAATPGGPCSLTTDAAMTQALGSSARAFEAFSIPDLQSCAVDAANMDTITIMHITATEGSLLDDIGPVASGADPGNVTTEPADGFAYSALFVRIPVDGDTLLSLRVQLADNDIYGFNTRDSADAPARLAAVGHAVLQQ